MGRGYFDYEIAQRSKTAKMGCICLRNGVIGRVGSMVITITSYRKLLDFTVIGNYNYSITYLTVIGV